MHRGFRRAAALAAFLVFLPAAPGMTTSAGAYSVKKVAPARVTRAGAMFKVPRIRPRRIRAARLITRHHTYRLNVRRVRKAVRGGGTLDVREPAAAPGQPAATPVVDNASVLVIQVSGPAPAPASKPASSPPPAPAIPHPVQGIASGVLGAPGCDPAWGSFGSGVRPPGCWRPYAPDSPFNREIAATAPTAANSDAVVSRLISFGHIQNMLAGTAGRGELDGGRPLFFSAATDPVFTVHCTENWGTCAVEGAQIRIPDGAQPAGGSDAHLSVIDQASGWEYDFWGVESKPSGGGTLTIRWGGKTRIDGNGLGSDAVAAQYGTAAGVLRAEELASGQINHALFLGVACDSGQWVYPATKGGSQCADPTNAPPEGTRFQLTLSDAQIQALPVPDWKKTILTAMAHYGMIVGDTGGTWGIAQESEVAYTSVGAPDPWVALAKQANVPYYAPDQDYVFNLADGVDWAHDLRVVQPCASQGTC